MKKFINENGKEIMVDCFMGRGRSGDCKGDLVNLSISCKDSLSSWEVTPMEAQALRDALDRVLYIHELEDNRGVGQW